MSQNFENLKPKIVVIGVGGAGGNAVNNMIRSNLEGVEFVVANTDAQALHQSMAGSKIQLGYELTQGLGAGSKPDVGCAAAEETQGEIDATIKGSHMVFITAGMGGGTGTGAAPVIAKAARNAGILTVGVVTKPFLFEGAHRMRAAEAGLKELQKHVDTLIVIPNQNLFRLADTKTTFADAFNMADNVLYSGVRGVTDLMIMPGLINLDFADVRTVMSEMGKAMMGTGEAEGENRALAAAEAAVANPLLDEVSLKGAHGVLINITGGMDMTLFEVDEAANYIREQVDKNANIIFGSTFDDRLQGRIRVSVVATGIETGEAPGSGRLGRDTAKDFLASTLPQTQLEFEEESPLSDTNPLPLNTEEEVLVSGTTTFDTEEGEVKLSFWERIGLKKAKEAPRPELVLTHNDAQHPGPVAEDAPAAPLNDEEEDLDVPTFLRNRKP
jgi:cell division protein FtsZ